MKRFNRFEVVTFKIGVKPFLLGIELHLSKIVTIFTTKGLEDKQKWKLQLSGKHQAFQLIKKVPAIGRFHFKYTTFRK